MKPKYLIFTALLLILTEILPLSVQAWERRIPIISLSRSEGLSNGAVNTIIRDHEGYFWLGTWNGLNRWDGRSMEIFLPGKSSTDIHNHVIREIYEIPGKGLWLLTNKGISFYNSRTGIFKGFFTDLKGNINHETDISITLTPGHGVFVWIKSLGLFQYDSINDNFREVEFVGKASLIQERVWRIHSLSDKLIFIGESGNVWLLKQQKLQLINHCSISRPIIRTWCFERNNEGWVILAQRNGPSLTINLSTGKINEIALLGDNITAWSSPKNQKYFLAGSEKGNIYLFNPDSLGLKKIIDARQYATVEAFTSRILDIYQDEEEGLFIGTDGNGIFIFRPIYAEISSLPATRLSYPVVRCFLRFGDKLLIGTKGGGINILNQEGKHIGTLTDANGLNNNSVLSMHQRPSGKIWVGTDGRGINIIDPIHTKISALNPEILPPSIRDMGSVYRILDDGRGNIFLGTSGWGVIWLQYDQKKPDVLFSATQLPITNENSGTVIRKVIYALALQKPGIIWIGVRGEGLIKFNYLNNRIESTYNTSNNPDLIINDDILSLFFDHHGVLWVGSSGGIMAFSLEDNKIRKENESVLKRLQYLSIHSIQEDRLNNLWISTSAGIVRIDTQREGAFFFDKVDGLINDEYSDGAGFYDPTTDLFFAGGTRGIDRIHTKSINIRRTFPVLAFTKLYIADKLIKPGIPPLQENLNWQKALHLSYSQNSMSIEATPITVASRTNFRVLYKLLPTDTVWKEPGPTGLISLVNLRPGEYSLLVTLANDNFRLAQPPRLIKIKVDPPIFLSKPAIIAYILTLILIQTGILLFYRRKAALKRRRALEELEKQKERELQEYKIEFFTHLAHELRTPLTVINTQTYRLIEDPTTKKLKIPLIRIYRNTLRLQKLVNEIMQFRRLEKRNEILQIQPCKIDEIINEIINDLEVLAVQRQINFNVNCPDNLHLYCDKEKLYRILSNLISNSIKYNREGGAVNIEVSWIHPSSIQIAISDQGEGFTEDKLKKLFEPFAVSKTKQETNESKRFYSVGLGLAVTKALVDFLKGHLEIKNLPEGGATAIVTLNVEKTHPEGIENAFPKPPTKLETLTKSSMDELILQDTPYSDTKPLILIVDDEPEILQSITDVMGYNYQYIYAENGIKALELLEINSPQLIISDIMMPGMDGIELCKRIRENIKYSHLPIILLTARAEIEDRISGLEAGADSYIPKPFHPRHLKVRVSKLLEQRERFKETFGKPSTQASQAYQIPDPFLHKIIKIIDENLEDYSLNADYLSDKLAISKSSLYLKLKNLARITPHDLINKRRLEKAALLLKTTQLTVSEIIDQTGFNSRTYFYELFTKHYGCTPTQFRKEVNFN
ncbi:MAG: hypothetical protein PWR20_2409 [Bacteroidales bacterium]|jgi:signal transduction histidine kinase/ligand-binding sensor domain-containing protein/AraC-like DNA-binding protein|nr:hypothetical protein [Bacteroidales bacterium]